MKIKYSYEDYLFISSRIRAMEAGLIKSETFKTLAESQSLSSLYGALEDAGIAPTVGNFGEKSFEPALKERLNTAYLDILKNTPSPELFTVFTYPYDCNNLKIAIKAAEKGISPDTGLLPYGTVPPEKVTEAVLKRDFSLFPENMAKAAEEAITEYAKSKSPQGIDLMLDKALYDDLCASIKDSPVEFFRRYLEIKADSVNILSAIRISLLGGGSSLFERAFVNGGTLSVSDFAPVFENGISALAERINALSDFDGLSALLSEKTVSIERAEKEAEKTLMRLLKSAHAVQAGAEVVALYIMSLETEVKNIRILIAGKKLGVKSEELFERLCEGYV